MFGWCIAIGALTGGHLLPDAHVERAIQVQVYPGRMEIHYYLGVNDNTVVRLLKQFDEKSEVPADADAALLEYGKRVLPALARQLVVDIDGQPQPIRPIERTRLYKHHIQLECVYHVFLDANETPRKLMIVDKNFQDTPGAHRMAIKGREGAFVLDASVPPILARVERIPWTEMTKEQKHAATRLEGSLVTPSSGP